MPNKLALKQVRILASTHKQSKDYARQEGMHLERVIDRAIIEGLRQLKLKTANGDRSAQKLTPEAI